MSSEYSIESCIFNIKTPCFTLKNIDINRHTKINTENIDNSSNDDII